VGAGGRDGGMDGGREGDEEGRKAMERDEHFQS
jgi:hypothetical protein